ncbi:hypothetical protein NDU88_001112 [Pleurodeles waltl]|uniref:Reverse transcriptase zinc-binding domain-containing protein n=1 Tax=Pleurodeles waltl TaxID=8319 RepID=A0AAV7P5U1_PLEWA|nr:hypothetical protein NDU88_001112 [Pleurodeles waltl]
MAAATHSVSRSTGLALLRTPRGPKITSSSELRSWHEAELYTLGVLYEGGDLIPFPTLVQESGLPAGQFLLYNSLLRSLASRWFTDALHVYTALECDTFRTAWDRDASASIADTQWRLALSGHVNVPRNSRFRLIQFYIIHRAYLTPARANRYFARQDAACPRCSYVDADLLHMIWSCGSLHRYWKAVVDCLSECTACPVPFSWQVCVQGLFPRGKRHRAEVRFLDLGLITRRWKSVNPPAAWAWRQSFGVWAAAEGVALRREDSLVLRQYLLSDRWGELEASIV